MANSVDPDQTAPIGAVCSGSMLFASILNSSVMLGNYFIFAADDFSRRHFQIHFFLGALRVKIHIQIAHWYWLGWAGLLVVVCLADVQGPTWLKNILWVLHLWHPSIQSTVFNFKMLFLFVGHVYIQHHRYLRKKRCRLMGNWGLSFKVLIWKSILRDPYHSPKLVEGTY